LEWFQDVGGGPQNGSLQAMRGWLPGDEFIGHCRIFYQNSLAGGVQKYFWRNLLTQNCLGINLPGLQETWVPWMRAPISTQEMQHLWLPPESLDT
jgi:hypothetical protein